MGNPDPAASPPNPGPNAGHRHRGAFAAACRIIDANANRAAEGLRVLDDLARFALDQAELAQTCKSLRHDLRQSISKLGIDPVAILSARDTPGDVGTLLSTGTEHTREGLPSIARSAAGRTAEALRSIEECAKLFGSSAGFEAMRYRVYELERGLVAALGPSARRQHRVCVLITESRCRRPWLEVARLCIEAGVDCLQLREKSLDSGELLIRSRALVDLACRTGTPHTSRATIVINDRPDIAVLAGADAVHLGQTDLPVREVRSMFGHAVSIGVSTTNLDEAARALADGADSVGVGPMFATTTKHKPVLAGPAYLKAFLASPAGKLPHLAIGGISAANLPELLAVGCRGIAVSSAVCSATDPGQAAAELVAIMAGAAKSESHDRTDR